MTAYITHAGDPSTRHDLDVPCDLCRASTNRYELFRAPEPAFETPLLIIDDPVRARVPWWRPIVRRRRRRADAAFLRALTEAMATPIPLPDERCP